MNKWITISLMTVFIIVIYIITNLLLKDKAITSPEQFDYSDHFQINIKNGMALEWFYILLDEKPKDMPSCKISIDSDVFESKTWKHCNWIEGKTRSMYCEFQATEILIAALNKKGIATVSFTSNDEENKFSHVWLFTKNGGVNLVEKGSKRREWGQAEK